MFEKILIANRGEIALRVLRACKELGIPTVAVHSTADADAMHVRFADESVCIGPPAAKDSYLNIPAILSACEITGADAVHPGYGFLSENARFAEILGEHGVHFIGPKPEHIRLMGDKIEAKRTAKRLGIPVVPGSDGGVTDDVEATRRRQRDRLSGADQGGGRRRRPRHEGRAHRPPNCRPRCRPRAPKPRPPSATTPSTSRNISSARATSKSRCSATARATPSISASATARCSAAIRRCWRKAPRPRSTPQARDIIGETVAKAMREIAYLGVGTVEFLYEDGKFYFIEMNTRIQVEHPVTEMITDIDLILEQIRIAAGAKLTLKQSDVEFRGHAIECRINAENPVSFRPSPGKILHYHPPGGLGVRIDSAVYQGYTIPPYYDSLVGKLIVHGKTRTECLMRLKRALDEVVVDGIETTLPLFRALVREKDIIDGNYHIHWLEQFLATGGMQSEPLGS